MGMGKDGEGVVYTSAYFTYVRYIIYLSVVGTYTALTAWAGLSRAGVAGHACILACCHLTLP